MSYKAPIKEMLFVMNELAGLDAVTQLPGFEDATSDAAQSVLEENARFVEARIAPLNRPGDVTPSTWSDGDVTTSPGFKEAFKSYGAGGWQGVQHDVEFGGQGLPKLIATPCIEMLNSACLSFALCPLLTDGAIEALMTAGSDAQKRTYLANFISGKWTGTMNLTEPQAGSDLAQVRTRAVPQGDGTYRIFGQKIYITYGEHDMAENIVHLVLARTPDAPEGVKGISLFIVPKMMVNADGSLGARNDVHCASIEHKLGIKASPTAVLLFGDGIHNVAGADGSAKAGAIGELVGQENRGLEYMFIMMNAARFQVGMQGIGVAERAYQQAAAYAKDRVQSRDLAGSPAAVTIIHHPDVRRMLLTMRAQVEAARALAYVTAAAYDSVHKSTDATTQQKSRAFYEFMVPIVKGWSTELSVDVASLGVQVHGGMGYIEETGAAQYYRDARILPIYEGTTAIQANDFVGRKTARDNGATAKAIVAQVRQTVRALGESTSAAHATELSAIAKRLEAGARALEDVVDYVVTNVRSDVKGVFAGSVPYVKLAGIVLGGWQMARAAAIAAAKLDGGGADAAFYGAKLATTRFYADHLLTQATGLRDAIVDGGAAVMALETELF
ncbi:MAG TPA: acyl-CoA dehydrogenase [Polyangia bacterium]|jgi:butyryl-CoA dehydrogenase|nr:acyl-CoA dehydrogenase [Polyangia bacterium]